MPNENLASADIPIRKQDIDMLKKIRWDKRVKEISDYHYLLYVKNHLVKEY